VKERVLWLLLDARRAKKGGPVAIQARQRARLAEMVAFARANSPYYRELYQDLPARVEDPKLLPVTSKRELILDRYTVATTSGTTGTRGIFLLDDRSLAVTNVLALRLLGTWLSAPDIIGIVAGRGRLALVSATGGHFASVVAATRLRRRFSKAIQLFPVHNPLPEIVARLNQFRPAVVAPYASMAALLAGE
jgi:phenylacetate-CoA ligase